MNDLVFQSAKEPDIQQNVNNLIAQADRCVIVSEQDAENASDLAKFIKTQHKKAEDERKALVKPFNDGVKAINARFKQYTQPLADAEGKIKKELLGYEQEKRRKAEEEAEAARKAEEEKRLAEAAEAEAEGNEALADHILETTPDAPAPVAQTPTRGNFGSTTSVRKTWTYKIKNPDKFAVEVPAEYLMIDDKAVKAAIKNGERNIPGLEIYQDESIQIR